MAAITPATPRSAPNVDAGASSTSSDIGFADVEELRRQNTSFKKRQRELSLGSDVEIDEPPRSRSGQRRTDFGPSKVAEIAHRAVVKDQHRGKQPQPLLELMQNSAQEVQFLPLPPVLRGLYEFGFGTRGLTLMHCKRATETVKMEAGAKGLNMTDFSEMNALRAASQVQSRSDVVDALRSLKRFARGFYNDATYNVIDAAASFVDDYSAADSDTVTWNFIAYWISEKFGKYRGLLISSQLEAARLVATEFSRSDESFARIQDARSAAASLPVPGPPPRQRNHTGHSQRQEKDYKTPTAVVLAREIRGPDKRPLCIRFLSNAGCVGETEGECWEPSRAHFRPKEKLPDEIKEFIKAKYGGLAPEFADL